MATKAKETIIELKPIQVTHLLVTIEGDSDLVLNKMNDHTIRTLTAERKDKAKSNEKPNVWEQIITAMHWKNGKPKEFSEESLIENLNPEVNAPCISAFGLRKSFGDAIVRNGVSTYSTSFFANVNVPAPNNLVPITFAEHFVDEKLMSPKKGSPVLVHLNRFTGWTATFDVMMTGMSYSPEQVVNVINLAGFGIGIGSGRSSGFGRYHVAGVKAV